MNASELELALARCLFLTCRERAFLAKNLDNLKSLTLLSIEDICRIVGRQARIKLWEGDRLMEFVERDLEICERYGIDVVSVLSPDFPPLLREIHDPPFMVFHRGPLPDPEQPLLAIVGTRAPSGDGALAAARFGKECAEAGISVVSGLARGIDAFAHRGNVDGGCPSVAVLACGVERIYPLSNVRLAGRLLEAGGCILSEYPPGEPPLRYHFPQRNRLIAGLSRAVLVVEAPEKSGALITADFALEQGRDLYVYAGTLTSRRGQGGRSLADQGAQAVGSVSDIRALWGCSALPPGYPPRGGQGQLMLDI